MESIWLVYCAESAYGRVRAEVRKRDVRARIARVNSVEGAVQLGRACAAADVHVVFGCDSQAVATTVAGMAFVRQSLDGVEVLVIADGCDAPSIAHLLRTGATEVIATGASEDAQVRSEDSTTLEACMEPDEFPQRTGEIALVRDDMVPLEELWPPLDEPDDAEWPEDVSIMSPPVAELRDGAPAGGEEAASDLREVAARAGTRSVAHAATGTHRAPLVTVVSGRGGVGKTTLVAALAASSARAGLRAAVLDLDLMFGDLPAVLGAETRKGLEGLVAHERDDFIAECDVEATAMRVGPGLTLWGPLTEGEKAELFGTPIEQLIEVLRGAADVIYADTSNNWGDAAAVAIGACDRCLIVGGSGETSGSSAAAVVSLAARLGVPATRMTSVFNRIGARGCGEEEALRFEMGTSLRSRVRIADGGEDVRGMLSFGKLDALVAGNSAFAESVRTFAAQLLGELGCSVDKRLMAASPQGETRGTKFRLPWRKRSGGAR
ncbi:P-loop NTPase [Collinsella sp. AF08-23]|uniref:AAA family ATPase n=1 Tax=Collinsella sp. AF08-23 TaxID=2292211 RepID=UPI000E47F3D1|nr:P-loop NTPase [Collinsella sp. AF08-23]RHS41265.1 hypothetical protein DWV48_02145 [Collinsella sp. AF08-23]